MLGGPTCANRSCSEPPVSVGCKATVVTASMGPVSNPASMRIIVMPLALSPACIALCMGAAPRQRGSSEAWTFMQPNRGMSSNRFG